jgi:hypothetical protein
MGLWDQFLVVDAQSSDVGVPRAQPLGSHDGWHYLRLPTDWSIETSAAVESTARKLRASVIGAYVADSDAAAIYFDDADGLSGWIAINPAYGDSPAEHTRRWTDLDARREGADELARWATAHAPRKPSSDEIMAALADLEDDELSTELGMAAMVFAEDGLRAVFQDLLGFRSLDDTVFLVGQDV